MSQPRRPLGLTLGALSLLALVLLPLGGMILAWRRPPGLFEPPPITLDRIWPLLGRSVALALVVCIASLALGTWLAWVEHRGRYRGRALWAVLSILPLAVPSYLLATIIRELMAPNGWLGAPLGLQGRFTGFWPSALVLTIGCTPYVHLLVGAALSRFPGSMEEAARSLGAGSWRRFTSLYVPYLRPTWAFALILVALYVISDFGAVAVLDCEVLTWELYRAKGGKDGVLIGFGLIAVVLPLLLGARWLQGREAGGRAQGTHRAAPRRSLGAPALAVTWILHLLLVGLGVILPTLALGSWLWGGLAHGARIADIWGPLWQTLAFSLVGGALTVAAALIPAWRNGRSRPAPGARADWLAPVIEHGTYLTSAVPGVLVAYGLLQLLVSLKQLGGPWLGLERWGVFLMLGYMMRYLAQGYGALKPGVIALDPRQEEAARSLGAGPWRRLRHVALPALAPGFAAASLLVCLSLMKELPITLMLTPLGAQTLAFRIFDASREGSLPDVGIAGLILLLIALGAQILLLRWRRHV